MKNLETLTDYNRTEAVMNAAPHMHIALLRVAEILQRAAGDMRKPSTNDLNRIFAEVHTALTIAHGGK